MEPGTGEGPAQKQQTERHYRIDNTDNIDSRRLHTRNVAYQNGLLERRLSEARQQPFNSDHIDNRQDPTRIRRNEKTESCQSNDSKTSRSTHNPAEISLSKRMTMHSLKIDSSQDEQGLKTCDNVIFQTIMN